MTSQPDRHAEDRERKRHRGQHGMRVSGRSTKTVTLKVIEAKAASKPTIAVCPNCQAHDAFAYCEECGWHPRVKGCRCPDCR